MVFTGLGILTFQLFPFALPLLVLVIGPLVPLAVVGVLLAAPVVLPIWLVRTVRRARSRRRDAARARRAGAHGGPPGPGSRWSEPLADA